MMHCYNCGATLSGASCDDCGLTVAAAEFQLRRRMLMLTAVLLVGAVTFLPTSRLYPPLELDGIFIFLGALVFVALALAVVAERRARRRVDLEVLRRIFVALVPMPWLLTGLLLANGRFDYSPPVNHVTSVVGKFTMPGALRSTRLVVNSWRPGRRIERIPMDREDFHRYQRGDVVEIRVQEGLAGIPWVYAVRHR